MIKLTPEELQELDYQDLLEALGIKKILIIK